MGTIQTVVMRPIRTVDVLEIMIIPPKIGVEVYMLGLEDCSEK